MQNSWFSCLILVENDGFSFFIFLEKCKFYFVHPPSPTRSKGRNVKNPKVQNSWFLRNFMFFESELGGKSSFWFFLKLKKSGRCWSGIPLYENKNCWIYALLLYQKSPKSWKNKEKKCVPFVNCFKFFCCQYHTF